MVKTESSILSRSGWTCSLMLAGRSWWLGWERSTWILLPQRLSLFMSVTCRGFVTLETTATAGSVSATPAPAGFLISRHNPPSSSSSLVTSSFEKKVELARNKIDQLEEEFTDIKSDARESLSERENRDQKFLSKFRDHLLDLPCTKKQVHVQFFVRNEKEILESDTIQKLFIILGRHCNYTNYEIILHIVKRFCKELTQRMLSYRDSLIVFEHAWWQDLCWVHENDAEDKQASLWVHTAWDPRVERVNWGGGSSGVLCCVHWYPRNKLSVC